MCVSMGAISVVTMVSAIMAAMSSGVRMPSSSPVMAAAKEVDNCGMVEAAMKELSVLLNFAMRAPMNPLMNLDTIEAPTIDPIRRPVCLKARRAPISVRVPTRMKNTGMKMP